MEVKKIKGVAYVWIAVLVMIFIIILLYNVFSYPLGQVQLISEKMVNATAEEGSDLATNALATIELIETSWTYWPIFFIFGLLLWAVASSQKKEPVYAGYPY